MAQHDRKDRPETHSTTEPPREPREPREPHIRLQHAVDEIDDILVRLSSLASRISSTDNEQLVQEKSCTRSLRETLTDLPVVIYSKIGTAHDYINDIEYKLFQE